MSDSGDTRPLSYRVHNDYSAVSSRSHHRDHTPESVVTVVSEPRIVVFSRRFVRQRCGNTYKAWDDPVPRQLHGSPVVLLRFIIWMHGWNERNSEWAELLSHMVSCVSRV